MSRYKGQERRLSPRFGTDLNIQFFVTFDVQTKIDFRIQQDPAGRLSDKRYRAVGKNVSVEGLCFLADKLLNPGDKLLLEVFIPSAKSPIKMEGQVKWSGLADEGSGAGHYESGVKVLTVNGQTVESSIFLDNVHNILWSNLLEAIFGNFKTFAIRQKLHPS